MASSSEYAESHTDTAILNNRTTARSTGDDAVTEKKRILKNVFLIGIIFCLLFLSFGSLCDLQSSLFTDEGLGVICQAIIYSAFIVSSCFLPTLAIASLGHKWTLVVSMYGYIVWITANGYPSWVTMTTSSVLVGISAGPLWTAFGAYINILATRYATITGKPRKSILPLFFGMAVAQFKSSRLFGSLLSWAVFQPDLSNATATASDNSQYCGAADCPWLNTTNKHYDGPSAKQLWIMIGCCTAISILSLVIAIVCLDSIPPDWYLTKEALGQSTKTEIRKSLLAAGKLHGDYRQLLLIPQLLYYGMMFSFIQADFTKSFVTCALGIWMVGIILLSNSAISIVASILSGKIARLIKTFPQLYIAIALDAIVLLLVLFWKPQPEQIAVFIGISGITGVTDAIWQAQTNVLTGVLFPSNEAAYSNYRLWNSVGFVIMFATKNTMCVAARIYMISASLALSTICVVIIHKPSTCAKPMIKDTLLHNSVQSEDSMAKIN